MEKRKKKESCLLPAAASLVTGTNLHNSLNYPPKVHKWEKVKESFTDTEVT